jgi:hypothetical protein
MERATARTIEKNAFMVLQYSLLTGRMRLPVVVAIARRIADLN